ncbi:ArsR/SmtB family transcription factor [Amycolatopsis sp. CA-230715]|uniref:ArsR/SmtB family transcription factor n=1 Tax=Amycolatopsis sp. CA-230715 TaxID=2745196 RepID=UPI001C015304|nr:helix-turn-helix domain-containing protein [Amycolatopsis sp. CA-230715]
MIVDGTESVVLRVHFTVEDLLNVTFADEPAPLMELGLAMAAVQHGADSRPDFHRWRERTLAALPVRAKPLLEVVPPTGCGPLFLDPPVPDVALGLDRVMATPEPFARTELRKVLESSSKPSPWFRALMAGEPRAWQALDGALRAAYDSVLRPSWSLVHNGFHAERAWRLHQLAHRGIQDLLAGLSPSVRWRGTVLEAPDRHDRDLFPAGRGIRLLPSLFWTGRLLVAPQPDGPTVLVYPALVSLPQRQAVPAGEPLADLLGPTRAQVLSVLTKPLTTGELAKAVSVSASSASEHATVLRNAGLVATRRDGKAVYHTCTPTGLELLAHP